MLIMASTRQHTVQVLVNKIKKPTQIMCWNETKPCLFLFKREEKEIQKKVFPLFFSLYLKERKFHMICPKIEK